MPICCKSSPATARPHWESARRSWYRKPKRWVTVLVIAAVLLFTAAWVVLMVPSGNMHDKYKFTPRSLASYNTWRITTLVFVVIAFMFVGFTAFPDKAGRRHWVLVAHCIVFGVLLLVGNVMAAHETTTRQASEQTFATKFNTFYCDARTARLCLEGNQHDLSVVVYGSSPPLSNQTGVGNANSTPVATSIWARCRKVLLKFQAMDAMVETDNDGVRLYLSIYKFLDDSNKSPEIDAWCGNLKDRTTALTDAEQRAFPAPFSANAVIFGKYTGEWTRNMRYSNAILGSTIGCTALAAFLTWPKRAAN